MRTIYIFLATLILMNCSLQKEKRVVKNNEESIEVFDLEHEIEKISPLEGIWKKDTLIIEFEGTEHGEWGGYRETFFLLRNEDSNIVARFLKDTVPFDVISVDGCGLLNDKKRVIVLDTLKTLNINDEKIISDFIQRITELNLKGPYPSSNAGNMYTVRNTNKTLSVSFWNSGRAMRTGYFKMKTSLFGAMKK
ncbi:hypothetical protein EYV94_18430 [Puteibacter caeruleilacunae]|nr:hypothetical protein EYV94_18430 [Puteibacter caeruleilacunae]